MAKVQSVAASGDNVASVTTAAIATTTGHLLIVDCSYWDDGAADTFSSLTDSGSHSWTLAWGPQSDVGAVGEGRIRQYYHAAITGSGSHTFTLTLTEVGYPSMAVKEVSGHEAAPLDQTVASSTGIADTTHVSVATPTTAPGNELLAGAGICSQTATTLAAGGGYTRDETIPVSATSNGLISAHKLVNVAGAYTFTFTSSVGQVSAEGLGTYKLSTRPVQAEYAKFPKHVLRTPVTV